MSALSFVEKRPILRGSAGGERLPCEKSTDFVPSARLVSGERIESVVRHQLLPKTKNTRHNPSVYFTVQT